MIECKSIEEARKVKGVVHIEVGSPVRAYVSGDDLPAHCKSDSERGVEPVPEQSEIEQLKARIAELEALTRSR